MRSLLVLLVTIVVGLLLMEAGTRLLAPQQLVRGYTTFDRDLGPVLRSNHHYHDLYGNDYWVHTNAHAMRMEEEVDFSVGRKRIAVYGDSFTFGWGVEYPDSFFAIVKQWVEARNSRFQLLNLGQGGYSTGHVKKLLDRHRFSLKPVAVVYLFNTNDIIDNSITDSDYRVSTYNFSSDGAVRIADAMPYSSVKRFLLNYTPYSWLNQNSHLFILVKDVLKRGLNWKLEVEQSTLSVNVVEPANSAPSFTVTDKQMQQMAGHADQLVRLSVAHVQRLLSSAADIPVLVVWIPSAEEIFQPNNTSPRQQLFLQMRKALADMDRDSVQMEFFDAAQAIGQDDRFADQAGMLHFTDGHFNQAGNRWFAELIKAPVSDFLSRHLP